MSIGRILGLAASLGCACGTQTSTADAGDVAGCPMPAQALESVASQSGNLMVAVRTCPNQPPLRGLDTVEYTITDAAGAPQDGLTFAVVPFMPQMGHGVSTQTSIEPEGSGRYLVNDVYLFMSGEWQLQTTFGPGDGGDSVDPTLQVQ